MPRPHRIAIFDIKRLVAGRPIGLRLFLCGVFLPWAAWAWTLLFLQMAKLIDSIGDLHVDRRSFRRDCLPLGSVACTGALMFFF